MSTARRNLLKEMQEMKSPAYAHFMEDVFGQKEDEGLPKENLVLKSLKEKSGSVEFDFYSPSDPKLKTWKAPEEGEEWRNTAYVDPVTFEASLKYLLSLEQRLQDGRAITPKVYEHAMTVLEHVENMREHAEAQLGDNDKKLRKYPGANSQAPSAGSSKRERLLEAGSFTAGLALNANSTFAIEGYCWAMADSAALEKLANFAVHMAQELDIPQGRGRKT